MDLLLEEQSDGNTTEGVVRSNASTGTAADLDGNNYGDRGQREAEHFKNGLIYYSEREDSRDRYYYSGLWKLSEVASLARLYKRLHEASSVIRFLYAFIHGNHVHVIHDCTNSNSICRCFKHKLTKRRSVRRRLRDLTRENINAIVLYFFAEGYFHCYGQMRIYNGTRYSNRVIHYKPENSDGWRALGETDVEVSESEDGTIFGFQERGAEFSSAEIFGITEADEASDESNPGETGAGGESSVPRRLRKRKAEIFSKGGVRRNRNNATAKEIEKAILSVLCTPIKETLISRYFQQDEFLKYLDEGEESVRKALRAIDLKFKNMTIEELIDFYENGEFHYRHPLWFAHSLDMFKETYMDITKSYNMLVLWIGYQWCDLRVQDNMEYQQSDITTDLWQEIAIIVEKILLWLQGKLGRKFTLYLIGPTLCGKTMFADLIMDFRLSVGVMKNFNRNSSFPLQQCNHKDLYYLNEPNIESAALEDWKKMTGGDRHSLDVKYKDGTTQSGSKVLLTANNYALPRDDIFNSRIEYLHCKSAPFLKIANSKRYHPYALIKLIRVCEDVLERKIVLSKEITPVHTQEDFIIPK